jgi:hypothetical protein
MQRRQSAAVARRRQPTGGRRLAEGAWPALAPVLDLHAPTHVWEGVHVEWHVGERRTVGARSARLAHAKVVALALPLLAAEAADVAAAGAATTRTRRRGERGLVDGAERRVGVCEAARRVPVGDGGRPRTEPDFAELALNMLDIHVITVTARAIPAQRAP